MVFRLPTMTETRAFLIAVGHAALPDRNWGNARSYHGRRATFFAAGITQVIAAARDMLENLFPTTARDDGGIDRWGALYAIARNAATGASKSAAGRVRGTVGTPVPLGQELTHASSGLRYKIATATTIPAAGYIDADIAAIDVGAQTRLDIGEVLSFVATPVNLETGVQLVKDLDENGFDREGFGAYRDRILAALAEPTAGGNQADYVRWGLEVDGISSAYCYPNRAGVGTVDVVGLKAGTGAAREMSGGELATYTAYLRTKAPASVTGLPGSLRGLDVVIDAQSVEIALTPNGEAAYAFDWVGPITVLAWTGATRTLQFTAALPASLKAGHGLCLKGVASAQDGQEYRIEAIAAADSVILEVVPAVAPVATDVAYSGGPLVTPIRDAIVAHMNGETVYAGKGGVPLAQSSLTSTVGLEKLADGIGPANPAGVYGTWSGGLIRGVLGKIAIYARGVRDYNIVTPAANYEATDYTFPLDAQIGLIVPLAVLVRSA